MKIAIINLSSEVYNLGAARIAEWARQQGNEVIISPRADTWTWQCDKAFLSAIFTQDLPNLVADALTLKSHDVEIEMGGPAVTAMPQYVESKTGLKPHVGLDERFEHIQGNFNMIFTSRGCHNHCKWCIVPRLEPEHKEYRDFPIPVGRNPWIGDNNILSTSWEHQEYVVERLKNIRNLDINSGFESPLFFEEHYQLYKNLKLEAWRLAFDSMDREAEFRRAVGILKKHNIGYRQILVFNLIGFPESTFEEDMYRLETTRALGCSPYPMKFLPLNSLTRDYVAPGFERDKLELLRLYWIHPPTWRRSSFADFHKGYKPVAKEQLPLSSFEDD